MISIKCAVRFKQNYRILYEGAVTASTAWQSAANIRCKLMVIRTAAKHIAVAEI